MAAIEHRKEYPNELLNSSLSEGATPTARKALEEVRNHRLLHQIRFNPLI